MGTITKYKYIIGIIVLTFLSIFPLLKPGFPPTHDGEYHVIRFYEFYKTFIGGDLYPRWAPGLYYQYGIPLFNYVYPLPNYIASFLHLLGLSFIDSFKYSMVIASFVGALFFYLWARIFWGAIGGFVGAVLYTYTPYHFLDMYVRGSVGEVWALALMPAVLWAFTHVALSHKTKWGILGPIFLSLLIFSHNIQALLFCSFLIFYIVFLLLTNKVSAKVSQRVGLYLVLGVLLASLFWMPALFEKKYVEGLEIYPISENFPEVYQLIFPSWGTGFSGQLDQNQMSFQIGIVNIFVAILSLVALYVIQKKNKKYFHLALFFITSLFITVFLMLRFSHALWEVIPLLNYFQFPWRMLSLTMLITSFLAGFVTYVFPKKSVVGFLIVISAVLFTIEYTRPAYYHYRDDQYYFSRSNFIDGTNSPGNLFNTVWNKKVSSRPKELLEVEGIAETLEISPTSLVADVITSIDQQVIVNKSYFPGWTAYVDGRKTPIRNVNGTMGVDSPKGAHRLRVQLELTPIQRTATFISIASFMVIIYIATQSYARIKRVTNK